METKVVNEGVDPALFEINAQDFFNVPLYKILEFQLCKMAPGQAWIQLTAREQHINIRQSIHGGIIGLLADTAMGTAIRSLGVKGVTIDLITHFMAPTKFGDTLMAEGRVVLKGKKHIVAESEVTSDKGRLVAKTRGSFLIEGVVDF